MTDVSQLIPQLLPLVQQVLGGALNAGGSGLVGKLREMGAVSGFMTEAAEQFQSNSIIQGVLAGLTEGKNPLDGLDLDNLDLGNVISQVGNVNGLLEGFGEEGNQVKQFIVGLAEKVVGASGSGLFGTGEKVNEQEQGFLANLRTTLGL